MNRRDVIKSMGLISLHALYPSILTAFLTSCQSGNPNEKQFVFFDVEEQVFILDVIDIIIPKTNTKSASEVGVHYFLDEIFATCLSQDQKDLIKEGLSKLKNSWKSETEKTNIVKTLDEKAFKGDENSAWFKIIKQYTLIGFFTSEEGTTKAGNYQKVPDQFVGQIKIDLHTLAHSKTSLKYYL